MMDVNELTGEYKRILEQLRRRVRDHITNAHDDFYLWRWLKAKKFNIEKTENALREHFEFRKTYGLDSVKYFKLPEILQKHLPFTTDGFDKEGNIVMIFLAGETDMKGLAYSLTPHDHMKYYLYLVEEALLKLQRENKKNGRNGGTFVILDLQGLKMLQLMDREVCRRNVIMMQLFQKHYGIHLRYLYIVNTPRIFYLWFNIAKPFIDAEMLKRVKIYEADGWKEDLLGKIEAKHFPALLGGELTDPDGNPNCITLFTPDRKIPVSYYICNNEVSLLKDPVAKTLCIRERTYFNYRVDVTKHRSVLSWMFYTIDYDIRFGVYYVPYGVKPMPEVSVPKLSKSFRHKVRRRSSKDGHEILVPLERVDSCVHPAEGEIVCEKIGTYLIHFDNTYSWMTPKTLYYKIEVLPFAKSLLQKSGDSLEERRD